MQKTNKKNDNRFTLLFNLSTKSKLQDIVAMYFTP